jgi:hypothetical protein
MKDPDPGGPKPYRSDGSVSATLASKSITEGDALKKTNYGTGTETSS